MPVITLTSDYGLVDHRVGAIKGSILSLKSDARLIDLSHDVEPYNLLQAAYIVRNAYAYFPKGTVHLIAVDSFYHKDRKAVVYKVDGHYFVAADNGILSLIFFNINPEEIYEITLNNRFDDEVNFTATDVLVPAAVHLHNGGLPEVIGRVYNEPKKISFPKAIETDNLIVGQIMYVDNFGNAVSNISKAFFEKKAAAYNEFVVKFRSYALSKIYNQYTDVVKDWENERQYHGKPLVLFNDADLLEISIYKGTKNNGAKTLLGVSVGEKVYVEFNKNKS
ncbi:SAM-dependent chlorinase/fluorinase [Riemerella anatipestifer]|uniref:SAM hydrolase/SAM-dependent halogenase family protein n=1 Tax=Riemerella anatipestifer TaxID=34085 RepID=UPI002A8858A3|nr:SAM-dependent chlorinase/fluorinase [Riemerella anatipestifer]MDY3319457.1 SAM-dependent chlorinase/fluorinase [Riemerella anatipestifer]MDY3325728.1 SAM-dependent chlorinase/fluorinase [Riemerella anatipestifer]MDY3354270.1 SAM-dependent chlorinase/fluorinase [Riemerella anatipestifer]